MAAPQAPTPAVAVLVRLGLAHKLHRYEHDPAMRAWGREAASALDVEPARVHKTLVVAADASLAVAVVPVIAELDLKALAAALGVRKVAMASGEDAQRATGYVLGGISPIGQRRRLSVLVDAGAEVWDTVFVSGGQRGLEIELAPPDLLSASGGSYARIARSV